MFNDYCWLQFYAEQPNDLFFVKITNSKHNLQLKNYIKNKAYPCHDNHGGLDINFQQHCNKKIYKWRWYNELSFINVWLMYRLMTENLSPLTQNLKLNRVNINMQNDIVYVSLFWDTQLKADQFIAFRD